MATKTNRPGLRAIRTRIDSYVLHLAGSGLQRSVAVAGCGSIETAEGAESGENIRTGAQRPQRRREDSLAAEDPEIVCLRDGSGNVVVATVFILSDGNSGARKFGVNLRLQPRQKLDRFSQHVIRDPGILAEGWVPQAARALNNGLYLRVGQGRAGQVGDARRAVSRLRVPVKVIDVDERLSVSVRRGLDRGQILIREPVRTIGRGREFALPAVDSFEPVVHRSENHHVGELVFQGLGESDGLGDVVVRRNRVVALDFKMRRIPEFRLIVQTHEGGQWRSGRKDARDLLVHRPQEFVHIDVGVVGGRCFGERSGSDRALLVDHLLEAGQVGRTGDAHRPALIA